MKRKRASASSAQAAKKPTIQRQNAVVAAQRAAFSFDEKKNIDVTSVPLVAAQATASIKLLNPCAQGTTSVTRAGRRITMSSLDYRFQASLAATTAGSSPVRILIVYDKQPNGALAAVTDIVAVNTIDSPMNLNNARRFKVLVDDCISDGLSDKGPGALYTKGWRDFTAKGTKRGLEVEFKDTSAGDITDITTGALISLVWQNGNLITAAPTNDLYTRIRFIDP